MFIQLDDSQKTMIRKVVTFADAIGQAGGFMTVTFLVTLIIVQRMQKTIYFTSLIRSFYNYQPELEESQKEE